MTLLIIEGNSMCVAGQVSDDEESRPPEAARRTATPGNTLEADLAEEADLTDLMLEQLHVSCPIQTKSPQRLLHCCSCGNR